MSLLIVATPIGNEQDITLRACDVLKSADIIFAENPKVTRKLLLQLSITPQSKKIFALNLRTSSDELKSYLDLVRKHNCVLVSDAGTPLFEDPGSQLVELARKNNLFVQPIPGPSVLACFISALGFKVSPFRFLGFPPKEKRERAGFFRVLSQSSENTFFFEVPYRQNQLLGELKKLHMHKIALGINLTLPDEKIIIDSPSRIPITLSSKKSEIIVGLFPQATLCSNNDVRRFKKLLP